MRGGGIRFALPAAVSITLFPNYPLLSSTLPLDRRFGYWLSVYRWTEGNCAGKAKAVGSRFGKR